VGVPTCADAGISMRTVSNVIVFRVLVLLSLCFVAIACSDTSAPTIPPKAPGQVFASARFNAIELTWTDLSTNEELFIVEVSVDDGPFLVLQNVPKDSTIARFNDPQPGHIYTFRVSACNRAGCSEVKQISVDTQTWLKPDIVRVTAATTGPTGIVVTVTGGHYGMPVDVRVFLTRTDLPQLRFERAETITPGQGSENLFIKRYFFSGLEQGVEYFYSVSLANSFGTSVSVPQRVLVDFTRPEILTVTITSVTSNSVHGEVVARPGGLDTSIFVSVVPVDSVHVTPAFPSAFLPGAADGALRTFTLNRFALRSNTVYKLRFTVVNDAGSASREVQFTTLP
jgi:hypothetical protein